MTALLSRLTQGLVAGAAGTTALNATTYLDMVARGRPGSSTPRDTVDRMTERLGASIPGDESTRDARSSGAGALLGIAAGIGTGAVVGAMRAAGWPRSRTSTTAAAWLVATAAGNLPMVALGVTDPRQWAPADWVADLLPHGVYALVTTLALESLEASGAP